METTDSAATLFQEGDHRAAFVFSPLDDGVPSSRPSKRLKSTKSTKSRADDSETDGTTPHFVPLFGGGESAECVRLREKLFRSTWSQIESRIRVVVRDANRSTLEQVRCFLESHSWDEFVFFCKRCHMAGPTDTGSRRENIPAGLINTGPNISSQDLLFDQLAETICEATKSRFVRIQSAEAPNLKAALRKIIRAGTAQISEDDGDEFSLGQDGRKYLDYDLEALHVSLTSHGCKRVIVAFQDSEAFDTGLLSDLISLFHCWRDRIQFTLLFGIATSVELFQARLRKSTVSALLGTQFDVVQAESVLESVFKTAISGHGVSLRLGPSLLKNIMQRQRDHVAGIQVFISSLKYAYMCHFYANPLSIIIEGDHVIGALLQADHLEALRHLDSFKAHVEASLEANQVTHVRLLMRDDGYLVDWIEKQVGKTQVYFASLVRSIHVIQAIDPSSETFIDLYTTALTDGLNLSTDSLLLDKVKRQEAAGILSLIRRLVESVRSSSPILNGDGEEDEGPSLVADLGRILDEVELVIEQSRSIGSVLKSKYSARSKVMRTTVVAQKVQLSQDSAALTSTDRAFTETIDRLVDLLSATAFCEPMHSLFLREAYTFDAKSPHRGVFVPNPSAAFERALSHPQDYLAFTSGGTAGGTASSKMPATTVLYRLYMETGALINVSDLWTAYYALVGEESDSEQDERTALAHFYRALAELRAIGFVKQSRKKVDHIAKCKWL